MKKRIYLAIIPARGGSKGIVNKNIVELCGKPLIYYTIVNALKLVRESVVFKSIVSTDSNEIAKVALDLDIEVPFIRPKELAKDTSKSIDFILHALDYYEKINITFDAVILLQPTSPLTTYKDIIDAINLYNSSAIDSLISLYHEENLSDLNIYKKNGNLAQPINRNHNKGIRRQDYPKIYIRNGAIFITSVAFLRNRKKIISDEPLFFEMPRERSINIDSYKDLMAAESFLKNLRGIENA